MLTRAATLTPLAPFDFDRTARYATHGGGDDGAQKYDFARFTRLLEIDGYPILATVSSSGEIEVPRLEVVLTATSLSGSVLDRSVDQVSQLLGVQRDLSGFYAMASADSLLASLVTQFRGLRVPQTNSIYESIVQAIIGQQISAKVARMVRRLLVQTYGATFTVDGATYHGFPAPGALVAAGVQGLREMKLSERKAQYIADISRAVLSGNLNLEDLRRLQDNEVVDQVVRLRGVGTWTAQWLLVNALGREDGFPSGDLMLQKILVATGAILPMGTNAALTYSNRWSPYRSYATIYLFEGLRSGYFRQFGLG